MRFLLPMLLFVQLCCTAAIVPPVGPPDPEPTFSAPGLTWELPITVATVGFEDSYSVSYAGSAWDQWLGVTVFTAAEPGAEPDLVILAVPEKAKEFAGWTDLQYVNGKPKATVWMFAGYHDRSDIIAHEMGHVLGLAHDVRRPWSVMDGSPSWRLPVLTRPDCQALAMKYRLTRPPCLEPYGRGGR